MSKSEATAAFQNIVFVLYLNCDSGLPNIAMHVLVLRPYRKDNIYFRTIEEREKIKVLISTLEHTEKKKNDCIFSCCEKQRL